MDTLDYQWSYHRNLPHIQPPDATLFITFRLAGSLPRDVVARLIAEKSQIDEVLKGLEDLEERRRRLYLEERRLFGKWDEFLNNASAGPLWLKNKRIAKLMVDGLKHREGKVYELDAFCVMANHVHVVFKPLPDPNGGYYSISSIMHSLKRYVGREANKLLGREGAFWQHESYDHVVRNDDEWRRIVTYVLNNPVSAGLVEKWEDWEWSYCKNM